MLAVVLACAFHAPLRRGVTALWLAGAALAGSTAPLAAVRLGVASSLPFVAAAGALVLLALATFRGARWGLVASFILLGVQLFGVVGSAWQLGRGADTAKAGELRELGFDPTLGFALNLAFSAIAFSLFVWASIRWLRSCRRPRDDRQHSRTARRRSVVT